MNNPAACSGVSLKAMCAPRGGVLNPSYAIKFFNTMFISARKQTFFKVDKFFEKK
jgi:hypothetical protein